MIWHPDQDSQYGAEQTRIALLEQGFQLAMSRAGTPTDNDLVAYCTPSAWLVCFCVFVSALLRRVFIGWREDGDPMIIGPIHGK